MAACSLSHGHIASTPGALATSSHETLLRSVRRHFAGDWGDLCDEDRDANECALTRGSATLFTSKVSAMSPEQTVNHVPG